MMVSSEITLARNTLRQIFIRDEDGNERLKLALYIDDMKEKILANAYTIKDNVGRLNFFMELNHLLNPQMERCRDYYSGKHPWEPSDEYVDEVYELGSWIKEQENEIRASSSKKLRRQPSVVVSFKSRNPDDLQDALNLLKGGFVDKQCNLSQFRKIFAKASDFNKVKWIGTIAELKYFIDRLIETEKIECVKSKWVTTVQCFECKTKSGDAINVHKFRNNTTDPKPERIKLLNAVVDYF